MSLALGSQSQAHPFRTEKLSLVVAMIVFMAKVARRQNNVFKKKNIEGSLRYFCELLDF